MTVNDKQWSIISNHKQWHAKRGIVKPSCLLCAQDCIKQALLQNRSARTARILVAAFDALAFTS